MTAPTVTHRTAPKALYSPSLEQVTKLFEQGDLVPVYRTLPADLETPVSVYLKLAHAGETSFLLESVEGGEQIARYSFLGVNPRAILTARGNEVIERRYDSKTSRTLSDGEDALSMIKQAIEHFKPVPLPNLPRFVGGAVGFLSYDYIRSVERLPDTAVDDLGLPEAQFMLIDTLVMFDHVKHQLIVLSNAHHEADPQAAYAAAIARIEFIVDRLRAPMPRLPEAGAIIDEPLVSNMSQDAYEAGVRAAKEYIAAGDAFQIVLSRRMTRETNADPFTIYRSLRMLNPSPYMFYLRFPSDDMHIIGASPEMMVRFDAETRLATVRPIAGTAPRGETPEQDEANAQHMINDPKERAEHVMLVDLGRNDLGRVCDYGSVSVPQMMIVEKFSHVMHIVSHVQGTLRQGMDAYTLVRATFPAGTLSGAPKIRAMEIIESLEGTRRGLYAGAVGYFSFDGSMDTCIAIRTLLMKGKRVYIQAGAGLVADSDPTKEYHETVNKARAIAVALEHAENGLL